MIMLKLYKTKTELKPNRIFFNSPFSILHLILGLLLFASSTFAQTAYDNQSTITIGTVPTSGFYPSGSNKTISTRDNITIGKSSETTTINNTSGYTLTFKTNNEIIPTASSYSATMTVGGGNRTLNKSTCVPGSISGNLSVTPGGTVNYSIPIQVSPGSHGMQPSLSINYTGQGSSGELGFGWYLSGISTIQRVHKNTYKDGYFGHMYVDTLKYELDGQRLLDSGDKYVLENDPYTTILNPINGFIVKRADGTIAEYFDGGLDTWVISKITDSEGNYIKYSYSYGNDDLGYEYHLSKIEYTGNSTYNLNPYNTILFSYSNRDDKNANPVSYGKEIDINQNIYLSSIKVLNGGAISKEYQFTYFKDPTENITKLNTIGLTADGVSYNPTVIDWGQNTITETSNFTKTNSTVLGSPSLANRVYTGDVDGDGITDVVKLSGSILGGDSYRINTLSSNFSSVPEFSTKYALMDLDLIDWNNDGKDEMFIHYYVIKPKLVSVISFDSLTDYIRCFSLNSNGVWTELTQYYKKYPTLQMPDRKISIGNSFLGPIVMIDSTTYLYRHMYSDINGDGNIERITSLFASRLVPYSTNNIRIENALGINSIYNPLNAYTNIDDIKTGDFDGDGQIELLTHSKLNLSNDSLPSFQIVKFKINDNELAVLPVKNSPSLEDSYTIDLSAGHDTITKAGPYPRVAQPNFSDVYPGDFNGDGYTDLLVCNQRDWDVFYSFGYGFIRGSLPILKSYPFKHNETCNDSAKYFTTYIEDLNNDGKSDIIMSVGGRATNTVYTFLSNGVSFNKVPGTITLTGGGALILQTAEIQKVIGLTETVEPKVLLWGSLSNTFYGTLSFNKLLNANHLVTRITDGMNNSSTISYKYKRTAFSPQPTDPLINLAGFNTTKARIITSNMFVPYCIVSKPSCSTDSVWTTYDFKDALTYPYGKGFLGYLTLISTDGLTNTVNTTTYSPTISDTLNNRFIYMYPSASTTSRAGTLLSSSSTTMIAKGSNILTKRFAPIPTEQISTDALTNYSTTTTIDIFNLDKGRATKTTTSTSDGWQLKNELTYETVQDNVNRLTIQKSTQTKDGNASVNIKTFAYDALKPLRLNSSNIQQGALITTINSWDNYGNPTKTTTTGINDPVSRISQTQYDAVGRFAITNTDALNYTTMASYRYGDGAVLSQTDANGISVNYDYSEGGNNVTSVINLPDGNKKTTILAWNTSGQGYTSTSSETNGNTVTQQFDCKGQLIGESTFGFNGLTINTTNNYNNLGQLTQTINPAGTTNYTYDYLGRAKTVIGPGSNIEYSYAGASTTITDKTTGLSTSGTFKTSTVDAMGNITNVTASTGNIDYTYWGSGKIKTITTGGSTTYLYYDDPMLNQTKLIDPNSGTTSYTYNGFGELLTQTDNKSQTLQYTYEKGRMKSRATTGTVEFPLSETYDYYETDGKKGMLKSITRTDNNGVPVSETYDYDALLRPISIVTSGAKINTGTLATYTNTFDYETSTGRLVSQSYPSGLKVNYLYDAVGNLMQINNANDNVKPIIWQGNTVNSLNQWTKCTMGNGLITQYDYDASVHLPTVIRSGTTSNQTNVLHLSYTYNAHGQMTSRSNIKNNLSEGFVYDNKDRLIQDGKSGYTHSYSFLDNGNINSTSVAGTYSYNNSSHPFAVTGVSGIPYIAKPYYSINSLAHYTIENKVIDIENKIIGNSIVRNDFTYGVDGNRFRVDVKNNGTYQSSKVYIGSSEFGYFANNPQTDYSRTIITAPTGDVAVYQDSAGVKALWYVHTDSQGSWLAITDQAGAVKNNYSYDAWGRPRNPTTWDLSTVDITNVTGSLNNLQPRFDRGYTGHETMAGFGLINMNGRVYDPFLQRMLSPDIIVQAPDNTQNYNRYSYCMNNPIRYTDPSGYRLGSWGGQPDMSFITSQMHKGAGEGADGLTNDEWMATTSIDPMAMERYLNDKNYDPCAYISNTFANYVNKNNYKFKVKSTVLVTPILKKTIKDFTFGTVTTISSTTSNAYSTVNSLVRNDFGSLGTPGGETGKPYMAGNAFPNFSTILGNYKMPYSPGPYSQNLYFNQCAIRLSIALIKSGVNLSPTKNYTNPGGQTFTKKGEVLGAYNLARSLKDNFLGNPEIYNGMIQDIASLLKGRTGIIFFEEFIEDGDRTSQARHIDLWNGVGIRAPYFNQMMDSKTIWFWPIK